MGITKYGAKPTQVSKTAEGNPGTHEPKKRETKTLNEHLAKRKPTKGS